MTGTDIVVNLLSTCAICQDDDAGTNYLVTRCGHAFHAECFSAWERNTADQPHKRCPYCNTTLSPSYCNDCGGNRTLKHTRLHCLSTRRVILLNDGEPSPEDELKQCRENLDSLKVMVNTQTDRIHTLESEITKSEELKNTLNDTINKLKNELKLSKDRLDYSQQEIQKQKKLRNTEHASYLGEKERLQRKINESKEVCDGIKRERADLVKALIRRKIENVRLKDLTDSQTLTVRALENKVLGLDVERQQLHTIIAELKKNNQQDNQQQTMESANLRKILRALIREFWKLQTEQFDLKKTLKENDPTYDDMISSISDSVKEEISLEASANKPADPSKEETTTPSPTEPMNSVTISTASAAADIALDSLGDDGEGIAGLIESMEAWQSPQNDALKMMDPRLFR